MATVFTLTPQPIRVTSVTKEPLYLAVDFSAYDALDVELLCTIEGTATNAAINLITGMQTETDDGWLIPTGSFDPFSGTGQQSFVAHVAAGLLQYLRWDVSDLGGATSLTFYIRGVARNGVAGGASSTPSGGDTSWTTATLLNSWSDLDASTYGAAGFMKDAAGNVHLRGLVYLGSSIQVLTLPSGYRPSKRIYLAGFNYTGSSVNGMSVYADGTVTSSDITDVISLAGVTFNVL